MELSVITIKLVGAFSIIIIGLVIARIFANLSKKLIEELETEKVLKKLDISISLKKIVPKTIKMIISIITLFIAIEQLGITMSTLKKIILVIIIVIIVIIIFSFIDIIPNLISGIVIKKRKSLSIGQYINIMNTKGEIIEIKLFETLIKTKEGDIIHIPNSLLKWF